MKTYRILMDTEINGRSEGTVQISEKGANKIWSAYEKLYGENCQSMETREGRGGICWLSELDFWKGQDALPQDFDYNDYLIEWDKEDKKCT